MEIEDKVSFVKFKKNLRKVDLNLLDRCDPEWKNKIYIAEPFFEWDAKAYIISNLDNSLFSKYANSENIWYEYKLKIATPVEIAKVRIEREKYGITNI